MSRKLGCSAVRDSRPVCCAAGRAYRSSGRVALGLLLFSVLALVAFGACRAAPFSAGYPWPTPKLGAVVSEHPLATRVGLNVLESGGNAADAAVATALALAVVYPKAGNLGGGGFAVYVEHQGDARALDFRETAPAALTPDLYLDAEGRFVPERARRGPLAVGVPGTPGGLHQLWSKCGSGLFSFSDLVWPAVRLAREGFPVDAWLAYDLEQPAVRAKLERSPAARELFYPAGEPLREGQPLIQADLANTLERYARHGPSGFYKGRVAEAILAELERTPVPGAAAGEGRLGSPMTLEDLKNYGSEWREPLRGWFRGMELVTMPPPSSGGVVVLQALAVLEGLPMETTEASMRPTSGQEGEPDTDRLDEHTVHLWIEALRRSFADRAVHMGDPEFHSVPVEALLAPRWIAERRVSISDRAAPEIEAMTLAPREEGNQTTHLSVLDRKGNAVSLTTTINAAFGSGILVDRAGFFLNNEMDDFAVRADEPNIYGLVGGEANALAPGKRPLSSMTPTVVRDGGHSVAMVLGSPGGPRIITSIIQVLLRTLVLREDLEQAVRAPRLHQQWRPTHTLLESGGDFGPAWDPGLIEQLRSQRAHDLRVVERRFGSVQAIQVGLDRVPRVVSDPRRGGAAGVEGEGVGQPSAPPVLLPVTAGS